MGVRLFAKGKDMKPLKAKNYGSIPHLPKSRLGTGDHSCHQGQSDICTVKTRDAHDLIIVQEKLDGSNVGIANVCGKIYALTRAGYEAHTSPYEQHHKFQTWVDSQKHRFEDVLQDGERIVGEWLMQAHSTRYRLPHEPFVAFDIMTGTTRAVYSEVERKLRGRFVLPHLVHKGGAISIKEAMQRLGTFGAHGAIDPVEGVMYRVERNEQVIKNSKERTWKVDFLAKFVRKDKKDGEFLESQTGMGTIWNEFA
jgi:ATP-dependent RNA circularization protein (DNA/RNA ligase family)